MTDYTELVKALRYCAESGDFKCGKDCPMHTEYPNCLTKMDTDAADAIEALQEAWIKSETDATNLTGKLAQAEADIDRLNLEIDERIATEIELSNQVDALQAEVNRLELDNEDYEHEHRRLRGEIDALQAENPIVETVLVDKLRQRIDELEEKQTYCDAYGDKWMTSGKDVPTEAYKHGYADGWGEAMAKMAEVQE